jgi:hypothetical protein
MFRNLSGCIIALSLSITLRTPYATADDAPPPEKLDLATWDNVEHSLQKPVQVDFNGTPLKDAVTTISEKLQVPISIDEKSLAAANVPLDSPVTFHAAGSPGGGVMRSLLRDLQLAYFIQKDCVVVTSCEVADNRLETWTEDLSDLDALNLNIDYGPLVELIPKSIKPTCWEVVGGTGSVALDGSDESDGPKRLSFVQSFDVHEQTVDFLAQYRKICRVAAQRKQSANAVTRGDVGPRDSASFSPPPFVTLNELPPAELAIRGALTKNVDFDYVDTPIEKFAKSIAEKYHVPVNLDLKALNDLGITGETTLTKVVKGVPLQSALRLTLRDLGLSYMIYDDAIRITSPDVVDYLHFITWFFEVTDLVRANDSTQNAMDIDALIELITSTQRPTDWDCVGGCGIIEPLAVGDARFLVVVQTQDGQQDVLDLLAALRSVRHDVGRSPQGPAGLAAPALEAIDQPLSARRSEKIRQSLEKRVALKFDDAPLSVIVDRLQRAANFPVVLDRTALSDMFVTGDTTFSVDATNMRLKDVIESLFEERKLRAIARFDVLMITSDDVADNLCETRVYDVSDIPAFRRGDGTTMPDYEQLTLAISKSIEKETWDDVGGPGSVRAYDAGAVQALVVNQTWRVQEKILILMESVRKLRKWPLSKEEIEKLPPAPERENSDKPSRHSLPSFPPAFGDPLGIPADGR